MSLDDQLEDVRIACTPPSAQWATVAFTGEIDMASAPTMFDTVLVAAGTAPEGRDVAGVVVDFSHVDFVGVAAVNMLIRARDQLRSNGSDLLVRSPPRLLTRMLEIFDLADIVE